ncbi:sulfurtransferase TusA family protein [Vibrio japonicus]|uniref:Sulfurtransferase TusA family protein n=1 Tax=Vibrio japonicus TaxID=1824638 RepID=A0ABY5LK67_9VIBR|nr:sulfurtransferase TusA family protein [Vibrio japonicus]UUM31294.1 sulfurtransferase TusA family protein [Vibrio japonicus]
MEPNILDLRQERCPLALLLAKRHTNGLEIGEEIHILVSDPSSFSDIKKYLQKQMVKLTCEDLDGYFRMHVTKEIC